VLTFFLIIYQVILRTLPISGIRILGYAANIQVGEVARLINEKRAENGVVPLNYSADLEKAARVKGEHMLANSYWAHTAPDGTEPWKFFADAGYKYRYAGENLARDFSNPQSAVDAWMASASHRENLLSSKYQDTGIAVVEGYMNGVDTTIIVQLFGTRYVDTTPRLPLASANETVSTPTAVPTQVLPTSTPMPTPIYNIVASDNPPPSTSKTNTFQVLISPFQTTKSITLFITAILLLVLVIDGIVVAQKRIPRISGRTFAHFVFLAMILAIVIMTQAGNIL